MELSIIKIGNSRGIRFPKAILEQYDIKDKIELIFEDEHMVLKPVEGPRKGWDSAFADMADNGDDQLIIPDVFVDDEIDSE